MRLTVLGSAGTHPAPGRACSSYLLEHDGYRLLLDCGNGSMANLLAVTSAAALDAILLSHLHPDHFADLYGLHYALKFAAGGPVSVPLHAPEGAIDLLTGILSGDTAASFAQRFPTITARAGQTLSLGPFTVSLHAANHVVETLASRAEAGGRVVAFSGDSDATDQLVVAAHQADAFLCDSSWLERDGPHPSGVHLTGAGAGRLAAAAGAQRLLVTHVYPGNDPAAVADEARQEYDGHVLAVQDRTVLELDA